MADAEHKDHDKKGHGDGDHKGGHKKHRHHGGGGHGEGEHEGAPEWLISFADNVMLQMGFFVILLALNMKEPTTGGIGGTEQNPAPADPNPAMLDFAIAVREAFNNPIDMGSSSPGDQALIQRMRQRQSQGSSRQDSQQGDSQDVQAVRPSDYVNIGGVVRFQTDQARLDDRAASDAADIARRLQGMRWMIEVRGHTSAIEKIRQTEEQRLLAYERAMAVARALVNAGLSWDQLRVVACGGREAVNARPGTLNEHATNQRVEVVITQEMMPPDPFTGSRFQGSAPRPAEPAAAPPAGDPAEAPPPPPPPADEPG